MFRILVLQVECVKLFLFRTKLQDCFLFVKGNLVKLVLGNWLKMYFPSWIFGACLYRIVLSFRVIMDILKEGKISFILLLEEPAVCHRWQYRQRDGIFRNELWGNSHQVHQKAPESEQSILNPPLHKEGGGI